MSRRGVFFLWVFASSCAIGNAIVDDRFEEQEDGFVRDKVDHVLWEGSSTTGDLATVLNHCSAIQRTCSSYWRLPTNREWAEDVLDIGSYPLDSDDLNPPERENPEALMLEDGRYWSTISATRPNSGERVSAQWIDVRTGIGESANDFDNHQARCVCTDET